MKKIIYFLSLFVLISCSSKETTTYYLIRHAEKDRTDISNKNPNLNDKGLQRAQNWATYFENIHLDAIYSTNYFRTIETGFPTAKNKNLEIKFYSPKNMFDSIFQKETKGKSVLIVGHSNTTPFFANKILQEKKYEEMNDRDNSSLFIVELSDNKKTSRIEKVN